MRVETQIKLDRFKPREYQLPICKALSTEGGKYKKLLVIMPRRAGKDILCWNLMIRAAVKKIGVYLYCLPTFSQARGVIWDTRTNDGLGFIDYIPSELIAKVNQQEMKITLVNGSIISLVGSDTYDTSIVGRNPCMIVFSEYALADEHAYKVAAMPILRANDGVVIIISTPRGKNHLYELYQIAKENPEWFAYKLSIEETNHISIEEIKKEIASGEISEDLAQQEYWTSFEMGQEGSYYAKYVDKMKLEGRIGIVPWETYSPVYTAWDLGVNDPTVIIFFQVIGQTVRVIDYYESSDHGMNHFVNIVLNKPYTYAKRAHFPPHDIMARESVRGLTKREMYKELGILFTDPVMIDIEDGIELVRRTLPKVWIDAKNCAKLIKSLENYREEFDVKRKVYRGRPLHDHYSHAADAFRYLACALPKTKDNSSAEDLDKRYRETVYGESARMPAIFRDDHHRY